MRNNGLVYKSKQRAKLFFFDAEILEEQFKCPPSNSNSETTVNDAIISLNESIATHISSISLGEIKNIIKNLPTNKAPGLNGISNKALNTFSDKTILHLNKIFNTFIRLKHFPKNWKKVNIIMIPKPNKNLKIPKNHRPISLLNSISKMFEIALLIILKTSILDNIRPEQFAFHHIRKQTQKT